MRLRAWQAIGFFAAFCLFSCSHTQSPTASVESLPPSGKLSTEVLPSMYRLQLNIDPQSDFFLGTTEIDLEIKTPLRFFWMHGKNFQVSSTYLVTEDKTSIQALYEQVSSDGVVKISFQQVIPPQKARLVIHYRAPISNGLSGLYKVVVNDIAYAYTQFEPIAARECFPGFDEPRFKTPFEIKLVVPQSDTAISNTPAERVEQNDDDTKTVFFAKTKPLPTYLIAVAVGPFDVVETKAIQTNTVRKQTIPLRAIATKGMGSKLKYAIEQTPQFVHALEEYFGIAYPYEKLDIIAVPDFAAGAMENAGAITFRDALLLIDDRNAPIRQKRAFAYVMAHELAHQWFGNLVTMPWWDDLWLNEAFATWMEFHVIEKLHPEYKANINLIEEGLDAMKQDSLAAARQIRQPIKTHHDIYNAFDAITYSKGGAVLSMFEQYLGRKVFQQGIRYHLARFQHGTATAEDFIQSISEMANQDVSQPFFSFLVQAGAPLVRGDFRCNAGHSRLNLQQSRYLPLGSTASTDRVWQIPFCFKYKMQKQTKEECLLVDDSETELFFNLPQCPVWLMPNANASGYYRWSLPKSDLKKLVVGAQHELNEREQLGLIDSLKAAFMNGELSAAEILGLFEHFTSSKYRQIATSPMSTLRFTYDHLIAPSSKTDFEIYAAKLYAPVKRKLSVKPNTARAEENTLLKQAYYDFMAFVVKDVAIRKELLGQGKKLLRALSTGNKQGLDIDLALISVGVLVQDEPQAFDQLKRLLSGLTDPMQRQVVLEGLGKSNDQQHAKDVYELLLGPELRRNEVVPLLRDFMSEPGNAENGWIWFTTHFDKFANVLSEKQRSSLPSIANNFCTQERAKEVRDFFSERIAHYPGGPRYLDEVVERIGLCASLVAKQQESTQVFFGTKHASN